MDFSCRDDWPQVVKRRPFGCRRRFYRGFPKCNPQFPLEDLGTQTLPEDIQFWVSLAWRYIACSMFYFERARVRSVLPSRRNWMKLQRIYRTAVVGLMPRVNFGHSFYMHGLDGVFARQSTRDRTHTQKPCPQQATRHTQIFRMVVPQIRNVTG